MEYVKLCLGEQIDKLKDNIKWSKSVGCKDAAGNYEHQLKQFKEALKILSNELQSVNRNEHTGIICKHKYVHCSYEVDGYCKLDKCDID